MKVSAKVRDRFASPCSREGRVNGFFDVKRRRWCNKETRSEANRYQASAVFKRWPEIKCVQLRYQKIKQRKHPLDAFDLLLRPAKRHTRYACGRWTNPRVARVIKNVIPKATESVSRDTLITRRIYLEHDCARRKNPEQGTSNKWVSTYRDTRDRFEKPSKRRDY
jgi:hypothetical protein